ncbi:metal ABC transporter permease [Corynebacterium tapiri]|uniref:metal ABC transporter permease n=1 Tax=Corynebacterium tapiri TaxID=1448266 RepID=UPI0015D5D89D|nr:metal ABC transporter permease [Corynebacterium tapiri]
MNPLDLLSNHTYSMTLIGSVVVGAVAGALGVFTYVRRESLIADVVAHASLPGALGAFIVAGLLGLDGRSLPVILLGASLSGVLAVGLTRAIVSISPLSPDVSMAVSLSLFFGAGMMGLDAIASRGVAHSAGLSGLLLGNAATLTVLDVATLCVVGCLVLVVLSLLLKEFTLLSFDPQGARLAGLPVRALSVCLLGSIVVATVIGVKTVGLVLMVSLVVAPAAIARQFARSVRSMVMLAGALGAAVSGLGVYVSIGVWQLPTGPVIVVILSLLALVSVVVKR